MKKFVLTFLCVLLLIPDLAAESLLAQVTNILKPGAPATAAPTGGDALGRTTPSGTVFGFLQAAQGGDERLASDFLQMSPMRRQTQGPEMVGKLKAVMDSAFVGSLRRVSTSPEGNPETGTAEQQTIGTFSVRDNEIPVVLVRVNDPTAGKIWLFSAETLSKVPDLYEDVQSNRIETRIEKYAPLLVRNGFAGVPLWQWLGLVIAIPLAIAIGWVLVLFFAIPRLVYLNLRKRPNLHTYSRVSAPMLVSFSALAHRFLARYLDLPLLTRVYYSRTVAIIVCIGFFWIVLRISALSMQRLRIRAISRGRTGTGTLAVLGERLLSAFVVIIAILAILAILGFNLTTVLAGLGIGGIAIALAAQKTLENLFGGISVLADEVIRVGDYCRFGDRTGTVEDISLRSTRVRTDARTELSIPNGNVATMSIENFTRRDKIQFAPVLAIRSDTGADQLRYLLAELRRLLYAHPKIESGSATVRFANFDQSSLRVEVSSYVLTRNSNEFIAIREDLLFRIMDIVEKSGTGFAFPAQTLYLSRDHGLDTEKAIAAEQQVQRWRDQKELPFPDFSLDEQSSFRDSIIYPPPESSASKRS